MSRKVKLRVILFFITAVLAVCCSVGGLVSLIAIVCAKEDVLLFEVFLTANVILVALALIQAYSLLKLPTIKKGK